MLKRPISAPRASATGPIGVYWPLSWRRTCGGLTRPDQTVSSEPTNSAPTIDSANAPAGVSKRALRRSLRVNRLGSARAVAALTLNRRPGRSEEHTSELQSPMRKASDVFCLKKKKLHQNN